MVSENIIMVLNISVILYLLLSIMILSLLSIILELGNESNIKMLYLLTLCSMFYAIILEMTTNAWSNQKIISIIIISIIVLIKSIILLILEMIHKKKLKTGYELLLVMIPLVIGMLTLLKSTDLIVVFLSLELQGIIFYTLIAYKNKTIFAKEGALKYFVTGAIASILFILGVSLLYKETSYIDINIIAETKELAYSIGSILILISLLIKIGAAPFHFWLTDAYEGASLNVLLVLVILPKIFLFYYIYIFNELFIQNNIIIVSIICSALVGSIGAIKQTKIKRFLAYTVIFNNSFFLGIILVNQYYSLFSLIFSLLIYLIITILNILPIIVIRNRDISLKFFSLRDFLSIKKSNFFIAIILSSAYISAAGLPPLIGFFSKLYSFFPLMEYKYKSLIYLLILVSIIPSYYYLRVSVLLFFFKESYMFLLENMNLSTGRLLSVFLYITWVFILNPTVIMILIK
jgi:NADH-quinone oxidoreductase subunit N